MATSLGTNAVVVTRVHYTVPWNQNTFVRAENDKILLRFDQANSRNYLLLNGVNFLPYSLVRETLFVISCLTSYTQAPFEKGSSLKNRAEWVGWGRGIQITFQEGAKIILTELPPLQVYHFAIKSKGWIALKWQILWETNKFPVSFCSPFKFVRRFFVEKKRAIANNKGADQPARTRRLICAFVVRTYIKAGFLSDSRP